MLETMVATALPIATRPINAVRPPPTSAVVTMSRADTKTPTAANKTRGSTAGTQRPV
jgi:hypothetical protein